MNRSLTPRNLFDKKHEIFTFNHPWAGPMGQPERNGVWLIYGAEKHGKTWFALTLARMLSESERVLYVSAEEGTGKAFVDSARRAGITAANRRLNFIEYEPVTELEKRLASHKSARIIVLDNITFYLEDLVRGGLRSLVLKYPRHLFVFLAHEERNEPYTSTAKMARRMAKVVVRVQGLACHITGRVPGGTLVIDEEKASLYHSNEVITK